MNKAIKDFKTGSMVEGVYLLKKKDLQKTKDNRPYLKLLLADKTGAIEARVWEDAEAVSNKIDCGTAVKVKGLVDSWNDNVQVKIDRIGPALKEDYRLEDLLRCADNIDDIFKKIENYLESLSAKWIRLLAEEFLKDGDFIERFKKSPGAQSWHNAYIGGLLEQTYEVMFITDAVCSLYKQADRDICIIGAFLHDIGKIFEINPSTFEYTVEGGLLGHLPMGFELLSKKISLIKDFPEDLGLYLKHIILSHHGEYQQQSPVLPKTLEATIIYHADELASQTNAVKELIAAQSNMQKAWSNYVTIKNRKYLLKK